ncbi:MAG: hypothetical protein L3J21_12365 [Devosiaceae bacterium]|nr:hypothetical protein [Devosiaceae bacterium]
MTSFSERLGYKKPKLDLQFDKIDNRLRNGLWNEISLYFFQSRSNHSDYYFTQPYDEITKNIWRGFFKAPIEDRPISAASCHSDIKGFFLMLEFPDIYDFVEFMASLPLIEESKAFTKECNKVLEREKSAFRFVGNELAPITNKTEIAEIEIAQDQNTSKSVAEHIDTAVSLYSNREKPDYRNSIKESISAVEAAAKEVTGDRKATLGTALSKLEKARALHEALKKGFSSLYGWTGDSDGIRHAMMDKSNLTEADARYMLVSCSAFANYLLSKNST